MFYFYYAGSLQSKHRSVKTAVKKIATYPQHFLHHVKLTDAQGTSIPFGDELECYLQNRMHA